MRVSLLYKLRDTNWQSQKWTYIKVKSPGSSLVAKPIHSWISSLIQNLHPTIFFSILEEKEKKLLSVFSHDAVCTMRYVKTWYFNEKKHLLSLLFHCVRPSKHSYWYFYSSCLLEIRQRSKRGRKKMEWVTEVLWEQGKEISRWGKKDCLKTIYLGMGSNLTAYQANLGHNIIRVLLFSSMSTADPIPH